MAHAPLTPSIHWGVAGDPRQKDSGDWHGQYKRFPTKYDIDITSIGVALATLGLWDIPATPAEQAAVDRQLPLPHTPDDLSRTMQDRARALCNSGAVAPIKFFGIYMTGDLNPSEAHTETLINIPAAPGTEERVWTSTSLDWPSRAGYLNAVPLANRRNTGFRFQVILKNKSIGGPFKFTPVQWLEVAIHEVGIHVVQELHHIELWRQGHDWPILDGTGQLDHLLFRVAGYPRYNLWRNKWSPRDRQAVFVGEHSVQTWNGFEQDREWAAFAWLKYFYIATAPGSDVDLPYMLCLQVACHFPNAPGQLIQDVTDPKNPIVNKAQSQGFLDWLARRVNMIFRFQNDVVTPRNPAMGWWNVP